MTIYEDESIPSRVDSNTPDKEYPKNKIITFSTIDSPTLGQISTTVRQHILDCMRSEVNPSITFNFCIDLFNERSLIELNKISFQKFVSLAEYISDMKKQVEGIEFSLMVRGHFFWSMLPMLYVGIPTRVSKYTRFILSGNGKHPSVGWAVPFVEDFKVDLNITEKALIQQQLIIKE